MPPFHKLSKEEWSWVLYDVANSAFVLVVVTALMPIYFKDVMAPHLPAATSTAYWAYTNGASSLILALLAPFLGALADYPGRKKLFFATFLILGLATTLCLALPNPGQWGWALALFLCARLAWAGANIFYDAFLVDVTNSDRADNISARGYAWGYIGSVVPFLAVLALLASSGNLSQGLPVHATKISFVLVALWWCLFSLPAMRHLKQRHAVPASSTPVRDTLKRLATTLQEVRQRPKIFLFLLAYFFYIDGVDTIISMASVYGRDLGFSPSALIVVLLFIQAVAFPCTLAYAQMTTRMSSLHLLMVGIGVYVCITLLAFLLPFITLSGLRTATFWLIAFLVASSMGGIQALSRSCYSQLIPKEKSAQFFGIYNIFGKFAAIFGPFLLGITGQLTGDSRWGVLSLLPLFLIGAYFLVKVHKRSACGHSPVSSL
ncbi:MAG: MFS transporter [Desulfobulbaceae bacterium]|nr:MFS transporter [Desulfobulbaceae bacterium]